MKQTTFETENPYELAFLAQSEIAAINVQIQELEGKKDRLEQTCKDRIADGELTGKASLGGFSLIVERKSREGRTIVLDELRKHKPSILLNEGQLPAAVYTQFMTEKQFSKMCKSPEFEEKYKLTLSALDKACCGKKKSRPFVDITITETVKKSISMIRAPILEV